MSNWQKSRKPMPIGASWSQHACVVDECDGVSRASRGETLELTYLASTHLKLRGTHAAAGLRIMR